MDLEVRQDERFQQREWRFNRVGWVLIALFVAAGLLGVLGPGPFSWATASGEAVEVEYQRVGHVEADDSMTITVAAEAVTSDTVTVLLGSEWLEHMDVDGITPQPDSQTGAADGVELELLSVPGSQLEVQITYRPSAAGPVEGAVTVGDDVVEFDQVVTP